MYNGTYYYVSTVQPRLSRHLWRVPTSSLSFYYIIDYPDSRLSKPVRVVTISLDNRGCTVSVMPNWRLSIMLKKLTYYARIMPDLDSQSMLEKIMPDSHLLDIMLKRSLC